MNIGPVPIVFPLVVYDDLNRGSRVDIDFLVVLESLHEFIPFPALFPDLGDIKPEVVVNVLLLAVVILHALLDSFVNTLANTSRFLVEEATCVCESFC